MPQDSRTACLTDMEDAFVWKLSDHPERNGQYIIYWMQNSFRAENNKALNFSIEKANISSLPLIVFSTFNCRTINYDRHAVFLLESMRDVFRKLSAMGIKYVIWDIDPLTGIMNMSENASMVIADMGYLNEFKALIKNSSLKMNLPFYGVESNITVPVKSVSPKEEYSAATFRKKILQKIDPSMDYEKKIFPKIRSIDMNIKTVDINAAGPLLQHCNSTPELARKTAGGYDNALKLLRNFIDTKLENYDEMRNDPGPDFGSSLSPYLRYGNISPVEVSKKVKESGVKNISHFLDELIIRRELSINFVYYNNEYDKLSSLPKWARETLASHESYPREYLYTKSEFENYRTHDIYWNAAQFELINFGKIHNYMRMYWGKKIIEWTDSPDDAIDIMIYLNNKYALDGNDPNSYAGIQWCFGKHDRPWAERPIFGKVRYMNDRGLVRKFNMNTYFTRIGFTEDENK